MRGKDPRHCKALWARCLRGPARQLRRRKTPACPPQAALQSRQLRARSAVREGVRARTPEMRITQQIGQTLLALSQLSNYNRHAAASERGPCFQIHAAPLSCARSVLVFARIPPFPAPTPVAERAPGMQFSLPVPPPPTLPFQAASDPLGPIPKGDRGHLIPLRLGPGPRLTRRIALHSFPSLLPWNLLPPKKKKQLKHLSAKAHPRKRPLLPISMRAPPPPPHTLDSILLLFRGARNGRGRLPPQQSLGDRPSLWPSRT